jgi:hypothetical protein
MDGSFRVRKPNTGTFFFFREEDGPRLDVDGLRHAEDARGLLELTVDASWRLRSASSASAASADGTGGTGGIPSSDDLLRTSSFGILGEDASPSYRMIQEFGIQSVSLMLVAFEFQILFWIGVWKVSAEFRRFETLG